MKWEVTATTEEKVGDVPVVTKQLVGHVDNSAYPLITVDIQLTLTHAGEADGPGAGDDGVRLQSSAGRPNAARVAAEPRGAGPTWQQQVLAKGWGYAIIVPNSIQADNGAGLTQGIIGLCNKGQPRKADDWGALRAWAWGASRALDYFETDKAVDAKQVGIEGLSRYGKAALVRWPTTSGSPSASSARPGRAGRSSTAATSASRSRTSPARASTTGWPGTSSSTPAR